MSTALPRYLLISGLGVQVPRGVQVSSKIVRSFLVATLVSFYLKAPAHQIQAEPVNATGYSLSAPGVNEQWLDIITTNSTPLFLAKSHWKHRKLFNNDWFLLRIS